jgi:hypothetical protein
VDDIREDLVAFDQIPKVDLRESLATGIIGTAAQKASDCLVNKISAADSNISPQEAATDSGIDHGPGIAEGSGSKMITYSRIDDVGGGWYSAGFSGIQDVTEDAVCRSTPRADRPNERL